MTAVLEVQALEVSYSLGRGRSLRALRGVSLSVEQGETVALVGESGSGKTTLARAALRLFDLGARPRLGGRVLLEGRDLSLASPRELRAIRRRAQMVFQDPYASLDPRFRVGAIVEEPLAIHRMGSRAQRRARARALLGQVGLSEDLAGRIPSALSGGQRQRVGLARALATDPDLLILDEPLSALDVSVQAQVVNLLVELRAQRRLTYLVVAHDLRLVRYLATRIAVMYRGRIVEEGPTADLFAAPRHPYTRQLLASAPSLSPRSGVPLPQAEAEPLAMPRPSLTSVGCSFAPRCPLAFDRCTREDPALEAKGRAESPVACFAVSVPPSPAPR